MFPAIELRHAFLTVRPLNERRTAAPPRGARAMKQRQLVEQSLLRCPSKGARHRT